MAKSRKDNRRSKKESTGGPQRGGKSQSGLFNKLIFVFALFGILLTVHYTIQVGRGFDRGCLGLTPGAPATAGECVAVADSDASHILGVSNATWGFLFYLTLAVITFGRVISEEKRAKQLKQLALIMVSGAFLYSIYLTIYQAFKIEEFCALCLTSAITVTILFVLHLLNAGKSDSDVKRATGEIGWYALAAFTGLALTLGVAFFVDDVGAGGASGDQVRNIVHETIPEIIDDQFLTQMAPCSFAEEPAPLVNIEAFIQEEDQFLGTEGAPVKIIDFFDPNCSHCKGLHELLETLPAQYLEKAQIYYRPFPIWPISLPQVQALYIARDHGKFFEMLDQQFARQGTGGVDQATLVNIAEEIGIDRNRFATDMRSGKYLVEIQREKEQILAVGVNAFPKLAINGKFIANNRQSMSLECIGGLVNQEHAILQGD